MCACIYIYMYVYFSVRLTALQETKHPKSVLTTALMLIQGDA